MKRAAAVAVAILILAGCDASSNGPVSAKCLDGTFSYSKHQQGTCSHHGGVDYWMNRP